MNRGWFKVALLVVMSAFFTLQLAAQDSDRDGNPHVSLTFRQGSSKKLEQVNGDCDWVVWDATAVVANDDTVTDNNPTCKPTVSRTTTQFDVLGDDIGTSLEHNGKLIFLFGDTIGATTGKFPEGRPYFPNWTSLSNDYLFRAGDPIASSSIQRPDQGLLINYFPSTTASTLPLLVQPVYPPTSTFSQCVPGSTMAMGGDDVPNAGISLHVQMYIVVNTNADTAHRNGGRVFRELET